MTTKLTVYIDDSLKRLLKETCGDRKLSDVVGEALRSYISSGLAGDLKIPGQTSSSALPSLSEVKARRPKAGGGSSAEMIAAQRRGRKNAGLS